jgi:hypothetical protein
MALSYVICRIDGYSLFLYGSEQRTGKQVTGVQQIAEISKVRP